jgi:predicted DNA-binding transcriptional regulator AlpA
MPALKKRKPEAARQLIDIRRVAAHFDITVGTVRRLVNAGEFPKPVRLGRRMLRWDVTTLNQWIAGGCQPLK